jgi:hypothetical protein
VKVTTKATNKLPKFGLPFPSLQQQEKKRLKSGPLIVKPAMWMATGAPSTLPALTLAAVYK